MNIKYFPFLALLGWLSITSAMEQTDPLKNWDSDGNYLTYDLDFSYVNRDWIRYDWIKDLACFCAFKACVKKKLKNGANINSVSKDGQWTPLSRAAFRGDIRQCRFLIKHGADVNDSIALYTPLAGAVLCDYRVRKKVFNFLLSCGADINKGGYKGEVPLMVTMFDIGDSILHRRRMFAHVLSLGADPMRCDRNGNNALMRAAAYPGGSIGEDSPCNLILNFLMNRRHAIFTFLCCLMRVKQSGSFHEKCIADALYQNRKRIMAGLAPYTLPLFDILNLKNNKGQTAYELGLLAPWTNLCEKIPFEVLNPIHAKHLERSYKKKLKKDLQLGRTMQ